MGPYTYELIAHGIVFLLGCVLQGVSVDLGSRYVLDLLQFLNTSQNTGYTYISGPNNSTTAILLEDTRRHIALPDTVLQDALKILKDNSEITFLATIKQEVGDSGSILAFSSNNSRFLELESSGRRDEIRFHYTHERQSRVETFPYRLADNQWHRLALSLSGDHLTVLIDCSKIYERVIQTVDRSYTLGRLSLFIGQRNTQQAYFKGALQDVQIVTETHGYLLQCPNHDTDCPTCAQYQALERKVRDIYDLYQNLSLKLLHAEQRISNLEECECLKSCSDNGTVRKEGEMWKTDACTVCMCRNGTVDCQHVDCSPVQCRHPVYRDGKCCPICLTNCYYSGKYFDHGDGFSPRMCVTCTCENGSMVCERQDPEETCPHLNCSLADRLYIPGECCPVCKGTDFCALGNDCHINATCVNLATRYACQCHSGFQGDGSHCKDIDECAEEGGKNGHHCHGKTKCVNTIGSYKCQCADGHDHTDPYTCEGTSNLKITMPTVILLCLCLMLCQSLDNLHWM